MNARALVCFGVLFVVAGCSTTDSPPDGSTDGSTDAPRADGAPDMGPAMCASDTDCNDTVYCNGAEGCSPSTTGADARGCVAGTVPCGDGQTCDESMRRCVTTSCAVDDVDADGHRSVDCGGDDCDDADGNRYPGNREVCDATNHDEDCDSATYGIRDDDGDGDPDFRCCNDVPGGGQTCGSDCDDARSTVNPEAPEVCNLRDDNCNGMTDESVTLTFHADTDHDGFGTMDPAMTMTGCSASPGYVVDATDCDDTTAARNPAAPEQCDAAPGIDENCNGVSNEGCSCSLGDTRACSGAGICASGMETCVMGSFSMCSVMAVAETCNGIDDDCNGVVDNGVQITCYIDVDDDGLAAAGAPSVLACADPARMATRGGCPAGKTNVQPLDPLTTDCNDANPLVRPGLSEACNGLDDDCNGTIDEGVLTTFYADCDGDGHGTSATSGATTCGLSRTATACAGMAPAQYSSGHDDCDDTQNQVYAGATELCDGLDNNCTGVIDEGAPPITWCVDGDVDGYPSMSMCMNVCLRPGPTYIRPPMVPSPWDCNDGNATIHPGQAQGCGSVDNDCDPSTTSTTPTWYADCDRDTFAPMGAATMMSCTMPSSGPGACSGGGWTSVMPAGSSIDCDDAHGTVHPFATELCDGLNNDCLLSGSTYGLDAPGEDDDDDGYSDCAVLSPGLLRDCNDVNAASKPGATETVGDGVDFNCDGSETCYVDSDHDGYRTGTTVVTTDVACTAGLGHARTTAASDCCDGDGNAHPGATAYFSTARAGCGGYDYNCDGGETQQITSVGSWSCHFLAGEGCTVSGTPGWSSVPGCGAGGTWYDDCGAPSGCPRTGGTVVQACR